MICKLNSILLYSSVFLCLAQVTENIIMRLWLAQVAGSVPLATRQ